MELPNTLRESLVENLDLFLSNFGGRPNEEQVVAFVVELLETWADDSDYHDDVTSVMADEAALDGSLSEVFESELASNDELEFTGEEVVSLLERLAEIEWSSDLDGDQDDDLDDEDEY